METFDFIGKCEDWELPSEHPYWENVVKLKIIRGIEREQEYIRQIKETPFLKKYYFGEQYEIRDIVKKHQEYFKECIGAVNHINFRCTTPAGELI